MMLQPARSANAAVSVGVFSQETPGRSADVIRIRPSSRVTLSEPQVTWAKSVGERLNHICALPVGWDGYRGRPTQFLIADFAFQLLRYVCKPHTVAPVIVPLPSGGLQIEWHTENASIELTIRERFKVDAWVADPRQPDDEGTEWSLTNDFTVILPWVQRVGEQGANDAAA
jgi:hypothetical protein